MPAIVEETKAALKAGHCVVIGLQTTGEVNRKYKGCRRALIFSVVDSGQS